MLLATGVEQRLASGTYNVKMDMTTGDARLEWKINEDAFQDVPDSVKTADAGFTVTLPGCVIKSTITGDAVVNLTLVSR